MCVIIGRIGKNDAVSYILDGLSLLEYRGYDSAGVAVIDNNGYLAVRKAQGRLLKLKEVVKGLIKKQFMYIDLDPYANAFNAEANGRCWDKDKTEKGDDTLWNWERKYELDSLCYPVWLLWNYYQITKDTQTLTVEYVI